MMLDLASMPPEQAEDFRRAYHVAKLNRLHIQPTGDGFRIFRSIPDFPGRMVFIAAAKTTASLRRAVMRCSTKKPKRKSKCTA
jgi:hypothetical protein